ncbi:unnamed protein product, partial [Allacma fusca]
MTEYTFTYFDARGIAESVRYILAYSGANWKENRIPVIAPGQSPIPDEVKARLRFGQIPLLEFDGKRLVQSQAISRYLAKQFKLTGKDEFEAAQCDEIVDAVKDAQQIFRAPYLEKDEVKKAEALKYTFTYYDARGLGEPARLILAYGGANWKDNRVALITPAESPIPEDIKTRLRFGQVPLLEFDGKRLVQSQAIFRYLAKQFNLVGKDEFEAAQCDEIVDAIKDVLQVFMMAFHEKDEAKKAEGLKAA